MSFFRVALQKRDKLNSIAADGDIRFLASPPLKSIAVTTS